MNPDQNQANGEDQLDEMQYLLAWQSMYDRPLRQNSFSFSFSENQRQFRQSRGNDWRIDEELLPNLQQFPQRRQNSPTAGKLTSIQQKYTTPSNHVKHENVLDPNEAYIKVTVLKNIPMIYGNQQIEYFINENGLIGSKKNTDVEDIIIGRTSKTLIDGIDIYPNDITLAETDRIISRIHCKLVCKDFFRKEKRMPPLEEKVVSCLQLPRHLQNLIGSFLECPRDAYIQDLGSVYGTHYRIQRTTPHRVEMDQIYSIGSETYFQIQECHNKTEGLPVSGNYSEDYITILLHLMEKKYEIHGLTEADQETLNILKERAQTQDSKYEETETTLFNMMKSFQRPYVAIKFHGQGVNQEKQLNIFLGSILEDSKEFVIGRGQDNHIKIGSNTISRKQTRFYYALKTKCWMVSDGAQDRNSANGTWVSLSNVKQKEAKQESNLVSLRCNSEIKISDLVLQIEFNKAKYNLLTKSRRSTKLCPDTLKQLMQ